MVKKNDPSKFTKNEGVLITPDHKHLAFVTFKPEKPSFRLLIIHGYAEHKGCYDQFASQMAQSGAEVNLFDLPGHGLSEGRRAYVKDFSEYVQRVAWVLQALPNQKAKLPFVLMGHSMGGLVATHYALAHPQSVDALILSSPLLGLDPITHLPFNLINPYMKRHYPKLLLPKLSSFCKLSREPKQWEEYASDPLRLHVITAQLFDQFKHGMHKAKGLANSLKTPLLMFMAAEDKVVDPHAGMEFFKRVSSKEKQLVSFAFSRHEILHEQESKKLAEVMLHWLAKTVKPARCTKKKS